MLCNFSLISLGGLRSFLQANQIVCRLQGYSTFYYFYFPGEFPEASDSSRPIKLIQLASLLLSHLTKLPRGIKCESSFLFLLVHCYNYLDHLEEKEQSGKILCLGMADMKPEEVSHPPMDQLQGLEYCIDSNPSWGKHPHSAQVHD